MARYESRWTEYMSVERPQDRVGGAIYFRSLKTKESARQASIWLP